MEYVRLLKDGATLDVDRFASDIEDAERASRAKTLQQTESLNRRRIARARSQLRKAREHRAAIRAALLLDEDDD